MAKVFITGGAGFVGSRTARKFIENGDQVHIFDTFKQYLIPDPKAEQPNLLLRLQDIVDKIEIIQGDTLNPDLLRRVINRIQPDIIIHTAALPLAAMAIEHTEEAFNSILGSTRNILEVVRDLPNKPTLVYISSSMVYGNFAGDTVSEDEPKDPKEIYGSLKLCGEIMCRGFMKCYGLDVRIVRPSAVYGPYDANQRVIQKFISRALRGETLKVDGDGSMKLDFTFVDDTAQGIFLVATHPGGKNETFNITRGHAEPLSRVLDMILEEIPDARIEYGPVPSYIPKRGTLSVDKAHRLVGYTPQYDLAQGVRLYIRHLKEHVI